MLRVELPNGATVEDLYDRLASSSPKLAPALSSALPLIEGEHVGPERRLSHGEEVALLTPVAGGCSLPQQRFRRSDQWPSNQLT